jgi:ATP-dependent protease HslVU (ClpYQ) peptidase subunit
MSIAVAVRKGGRICLASDTQTSFGSNTVPVENHQTDKIRRVGRAYMAVSGAGLYDNILDDMLSGKRRVSLANRQSIFTFFLHLWRQLRQTYSLVNEQCHQDDKSPFGDLDASFLVVNSHGIYYVASDMSITEFSQYFAIGSGADFSMGALHALYDGSLHADALADRAVRAAMAFSLYCGGRVTSYSVKAARR